MKYLKILLIALFSGGVVQSQTFSFQHIGVEEGLSQSVVTTVTQDNNGVFWIGTMSGITMYKGSEFQVFMKSDGLAENWVTASMKDRDGNLWFGHWGGGVSLYDNELQKFSDLRLERFSKFKSVTSIAQDQNGDIWFGTRGSGVFKYEIASNSIVSFSKEEGFQSEQIESIVVDSRNNIWFGTHNGIVIYRSNKKMETKGAFMLISKQEGLVADKVVHMALTENNVMIVGSEFDGLTIIRNADKLNELTYSRLNKSNGLPSNDISFIYAEDGDDIWIGSRNAGVTKYNLKTKAYKNLSTRQGLNYAKVNHIFQGREGNIWIGTDLGLNLFRGDEFLIYDQTDGLANNVIWDIAEDRKHRLWFGTNEGLSRMELNQSIKKNNYIYKPVIKNYDKSDGLSNGTVLSLYVDDKGKLWCGTGFGGISVLDVETDRFRVIDSLKGLGSNTVYSICQDKDKNYWVGTDKGASQINQQTEKITNYTSEDGLGGDNIYKVFKDSKGTMWFASIGGYLSRFTNGKFERFDSTNSLTQKFITSIAEDGNGNIWFGAYGGGLYRYDGTNFENLTTDDGLSSNSPYSLIADNFNNLWIGTSQGIDKLDLEALTFKNYRNKEGFMGIEPNPNAITKDHYGNVWFGTIMGAVKFDLTKEKMNQVEPVTNLERLRIDHEIFAFPEDNEFAYDENHITFEYIGVSLTNPEHVEYKYMLEGFETAWSPITKSRDVVYSNLQPGKYTFKVMASNNDGVWNESPTEYSFVINPPFWRTWWFYTLCAIALLGAIYGGDKIRMRKLIADKMVLERKVEERTQEIAAKNIELQKKNKDILDSINYAKRIQSALLPSENRIKKTLQNSFIFFRPKDIVSGDFYWMERIGDLILFSAADCTGHGVPGAFMSIIGHNGLNKAVIENGITQPSIVLDQLNEVVSETLKQQENEAVKDGMDIAFCTLNTKTLELQYAGAFNPLYLVRKGEVLETKADRRPIGSFAGQKDRKFTNHTIQLEKDDAVYLFSDGFPDQFGGPEGKKFRYKQFRELLVETHEKPQESKDEILEKVIDDWRGEVEQIDDIVVIGMKIS